MLNELLTAFVSGVCLVAIVSPRLPTGVLGSLGLGAICVAALMSLDRQHDPYGATDLLLIGAGMLAFHLFVRRAPKEIA